MNTISLFFDVGCFVLIWMVQLVVYPSFEFYTQSELKIWHIKYTKRITIIVLPLMLGQLILTLIELFPLNTLGILKFLFVLIIWIITFVIFVPIHGRIDQDNSGDYKQLVLSLIKKNWIRTVLWTFTLILGLYHYFRL